MTPAAFLSFFPMKSKQEASLLQSRSSFLAEDLPLLITFTATEPALEQQIWGQCILSPFSAEIGARLTEGDNVMLAALFKANKNTFCLFGCCFWSPRTRMESRNGLKSNNVLILYVNLLINLYKNHTQTYWHDLKATLRTLWKWAYLLVKQLQVRRGIGSCICLVDWPWLIPYVTFGYSVPWLNHQ